MGRKGVLGGTEEKSERQRDRKEWRGKLRQGGRDGPRGSPHPSLTPRAPTHQTAEVWPVKPGGGETQGHVRGVFSLLSLEVVGQMGDRRLQL